METTFTAAELEADRKQVYKVGPTALIALADKYGATTRSLTLYRQDPESYGSLSMAVAVTGTKSKNAELQRNVYAAIKRHQS